MADTTTAKKEKALGDPPEEAERYQHLILGRTEDIKQMFTPKRVHRPYSKYVNISCDQ